MKSGAACQKCGRGTPYRCGLCRSCRFQAFGQARRKYHWTAELRDELRRAYASRNKRALTGALDRLMRKTGWPRHAFTYEARRLGIITFDHRRGWTGKEIAYLGEHLGARSLRQIARALGRSVESIQSRASALGLSTAIREGYTITDLGQALGAHHSTVRRWIERGLFGPMQRLAGCRLTESNVVRFLHLHPHEYDLRRVDQEWFKGMIFGHLAGIDLCQIRK